MQKKSILSRVAVVILNWNGKNLLEQFLPSVMQNTLPEIATIYVADNGSTDDSLDFVSKNYPQVKTIALGKNYGFAEGYNRSLEQITEPYTVLLNSDVEVTNGWLLPLLQYMDEHAEVGACQPKLLSFHQREYFEYAGAAGGFIDKYGYPFCRGRIFNVMEKDEGQYNQISDIFWATGACLFIRTSLYKEIGGLDPRFFAHMEEIDLCWRIWARGFRVVYVPQSVVYHVGGATLNKMNSFKTYLNFRNNWYLLYKNYPSSLYRIFFIRFILDMIALVKFLLSFEFKNSWAVLKAHLDFIKTYKYFRPKRKDNLQQTKTLNIPTIYRGSIVYQFFIKRKKTSAELFRK